MNKKLNRRNFISAASIVGAGLTLGVPTIACATSGASAKPAILGGPKAFSGKWSGWPIVGQIEQDELLKVLNSGNWCRLGAKQQQGLKRNIEIF
jgi:perosamine synthetase